MNVHCLRRDYALRSRTWSSWLDVPPLPLCQPLPPETDWRVSGELTLCHIFDGTPGGTVAYIRNCDAPDVAYPLVYDGECTTLDHPPNTYPLDGFPALTCHYMVHGNGTWYMVHG